MSDDTRRWILESLDVGVVAVDEHGRLLLANREAQRVLGIELLGVGAADWRAPFVVRARDGITPWPTEQLPLARAVRGETTDDVVLYVARRDAPGGTLIAASARPVRDDAGKILGGVALVRDVTARLRTEELTARRRAFAELLRKVATTANESACFADALGAAVSAVCAATGWPVGHAWVRDDTAGGDVLCSTGIWRAEPPDRYAEFRIASDAMRPRAGEGLPGEVLALRRARWRADLLMERDSPDVEAARRCGLHAVLAFPVLSGEAVVGVLEFFTTGVTEPDRELLDAASQIGTQLGRAYEREQAAGRERFMASVVEHVAHPIFIKDRAFRWVLVNRAFCDLLGRSCGQLLGKTDYDYFPREQAEFFRRKDVETFATRKPVVIDEEPITDARGTVHRLATTKVPLFDARGEPTHLVGIIHEITGLKEVEDALRAKNEELAEQVRQRSIAVAQLDAANRELEAFSYSVSHDLRAPLRVIDGFTDAILTDYAEQLGDEGRAYFDRIRVNVRRMSRLIDDLLELSRVARVEMHRSRVDLSALARAVVAELRQLEPEREVQAVIADGLVADADPNLLRIVLENLLNNAWKFTSGRAHARIELGQLAGAPERTFFVRDNGAGFDMAYGEKLFRAFSRLHSTQEFPGTGVGLATVERVLRRHGGRAWAEGAIDRGATFYFALPEASGASNARRAEPRDGEQAGGDGGSEPAARGRVPR